MFGVATGWLGWTPEVAWSATVDEIRVATKARIEWLNGGAAQELSPQERLMGQMRKLMAAKGSVKASSDS